MTGATTKCDFKSYEYCVKPVYGFRWRCYMRYNQASPFISLPLAWDKEFMTAEDAERNCRSHAQARRDEYQHMNKAEKFLGVL